MPEGSMPEVVVTVTGPFEGAAVERWGGVIAGAVATRPRHLVVDLTQSPGLDAAAIVVLLGTHRAMVHSGGRLTLRGPDARVRRILRLARVDRVFDVVESTPAEVAEP
jgi:anti-anti-sigma factor